MKAFRIKLNPENTLKSSVDFIFLAKCKSINVDYSILKESAVVEIYTLNERFYTLTKYMNPVEFQVFASRMEKFQSREDLFFDLGEFSVVLEQNHDTSG